MNDSVRAAQIIFQKHASSQNIADRNSSQSSLATPSIVVSPQPRYKRVNSHPQGHSPANAKYSPSQVRRKTVSPSQALHSINTAAPEKTDSAQAAAQLAAANWNQNDEPESATPFRIPFTKSHTENELRKPNNNRSSLDISRRPQLQSPLQPHAQARAPSPLGSYPDSSKSSRNLKSSSSASIPTIESTQSSNIIRAGSVAKPKDYRTLTGRVPPPNIYLDKKTATNVDPNEYDDDADNNADDNEEDEYDEDIVGENDLYSITSTPTTNSFLSIITDRSSSEGNMDRRDDERGYEYITDDEDDKYSSEYSFAPQNTFNSSSLTLPVDSSNNSMLTTLKKNTTYETLNKANNPNVTYQGTLPDLIPNHTRRSRMDKIKTKLFGSRGKHRSDNSNDPNMVKSSVTSNEEGRPVVTTTQNLRFKTTMRGKEDRPSNYRKTNGVDENKGQETLRAGDDRYSGSSSSDSDSASVERSDEKKRRKRSYRLRRRLRNTAASVPYSHHLHHHDHRHNYRAQTFNEDKPWKSHNDVGFVTPQERKRYEGMWVSNRCLYLELLPWWESIMTGKASPTEPLPEDGLMLNLVVKDIWARSNLPNDLLSQIYEKVDTRKDGTLDRKSFIIGMWLVDQCLYGRKLPRELNQQVWDSVDRYVVNVINQATLKHIDKSKKRQMKQEIKNIKKEIKNTHL